MTEENGIQISTNAGISARLNGMLSNFERAAQQNVQAFMETTGNNGFTITERRALVKLEQLKLIGDLTLAEVMLRGEIIRQIEQEGLWSSHPMGFGSMEEAAAAQGISQSEYSNIRDLCDVVFPYLTEAGYNVPMLWEEIGKSKFRELTPILKRAITNEESRSTRIEQIFENEMDDITATAAATGNPITDEEARVTLVEQLIEAGTLPVRELRQRIRPERTASMNAFRIPYTRNQQIYMFVIDADQQELLNRRLTGYMDVIPVDRGEAQRSDILRNMVDYLHG